VFAATVIAVVVCGRRRTGAQLLHCPACRSPLPPGWPGAPCAATAPGAPSMTTSEQAATFRLQRNVDPARDHVRGAGGVDAVTVVAYGDFLCPYCRRLIPVLARLREAMGDRLVFVFRQFPNERAHPGAELVARATEAAARQGQFWPMHDRVFGREPPITERVLLDFAGELGLDVVRFTADMLGDEARRSVEEDLEEGRANGVTGTPTLFVNGVRYDGAWDLYSLLESLERPVAVRVRHAGRVFASLPASGGALQSFARDPPEPSTRGRHDTGR